MAEWLKRYNKIGFLSEAEITGKQALHKKECKEPLVNFICM
jgi:hypothetical protein